jgi:hypothetical protein
MRVMGSILFHDRVPGSNSLAKYVAVFSAFLIFRSINYGARQYVLHFAVLSVSYITLIFNVLMLFLLGITLSLGSKTNR